MSDDGFFAILDAVLPNDGFAVVLNAYFDASRLNSGQFCVAGIAFSSDRAKIATGKWRQLWGDTICHMTDLHGRPMGTSFEKWGPVKTGKYLKKSVEIVNKYANYISVVSCSIDDLMRIAPKAASKENEKYLDGFRTAYATCCHVAMTHLAMATLQQAGGSSGIAYFFEKGDQHQFEAMRFIDYMSHGTEQDLREMYDYTSHTVAAKGTVRLFETADILAWEWAKNWQRLDKGLHTRPSLQALLDPDGLGVWVDNAFASPTRRGLHLSGDMLESYYGKISKCVLHD